MVRIGLAFLVQRLSGGGRGEGGREEGGGRRGGGRREEGRREEGGGRGVE